jgi:hypothetical protein
MQQEDLSELPGAVRCAATAAVIRQSCAYRSIFAKFMVKPDAAAKKTRGEADVAVVMEAMER